MHRSHPVTDRLEAMSSAQLTFYSALRLHIRELLPKRGTSLPRRFDALSRQMPEPNGDSISISCRTVQKGARLAEDILRYSGQTNDNKDAFYLSQLASCMNGLFTLNHAGFEQQSSLYYGLLKSYETQHGPH